MHCSGCGTNVERDSRFCRGCGCAMTVVAVPSKKTSPFVKTVAVVLGLVVLLFIVIGTTSQSPPMTAEDIAANAASATAAATKTKRVNAQIEIATRGLVTLKKAARNPDSFVLVSALVIDATGATCYDYRAQNGFGGMNPGHAVLTSKGKFKTNEMDGFSTLWNRECANKSSTEEADAVKLMLRLVGE
jgi:hypothetical protein